MMSVKITLLASLVTASVCLNMPVLAGSEDARGHVLQGAGKLHVPFIENRGQTDEQVAFYANTFGGVVYVTHKGEIVYFLPKQGMDESYDNGKESEPRKRHAPNDTQYMESRGTKGIVLKEEILDGFKPGVAGGNKAQTRVNYFIGGDPEQWRNDTATYEDVSAGEIYPGVRLTLKAYGNNVEKIFHVGPGTDPSVIRLKLVGAKDLTVDTQGELAVETELGYASFTAPLAYQYIDGKKVAVAAAYRIEGPDSPKDGDGFIYGFRVGEYDNTKELLIDPLLASTYLKGSGWEKGYAIALDGSGNVYVTGYTSSSNFPATTGVCDASFNGSCDVFISKLDGSLSRLIASTYLGGAAPEYGNAIALDGNGNVCVAGYTGSDNFPVTKGAYDVSFHGGTNDVFISKLDGSLSRLIASTYLGGSSSEIGYALAFDGSGNVYVTGHAKSLNFPVTDGAYDTTPHGSNDVFVSKLDGSLSKLIASTFMGGAYNESGYAIALDSIGNVYVTGNAISQTFPVTSGAYDSSFNGGYSGDVFISKLDGSLSRLIASTYLGGSHNDSGKAIALDGSGNVYVAGNTYSSDYPATTGAYDSSPHGYDDVFISKLDGALSKLIASTYLGGSATEFANAMTLDGIGNVYVAGNTNSTNYPVTRGAYDASSNGFDDAFISKLDGSLSSLTASTFLGGSAVEYGNAIALDGAGNVYVTGYTESPNFPVTKGAYDVSTKGANDAFVVKIDGGLTALPQTVGEKAAKGEKK